MAQQGQVFPLGAQDRDGTRWAFRYRVGGRGSRRVQRGGFRSEQAAAEALERVLERLRREHGLVETPTLAEFVEVYLAQHEGEPETIFFSPFWLDVVRAGEATEATEASLGPVRGNDA